jgi:hypothetical protein
MVGPAIALPPSCRRTPPEGILDGRECCDALPGGPQRRGLKATTGGRFDAPAHRFQGVVGVAAPLDEEEQRDRQGRKVRDARRTTPGRTARRLALPQPSILTYLVGLAVSAVARATYLVVVADGGWVD